MKTWSGPWVKFRDPAAGEGETDDADVVINPSMVVKLRGSREAKTTTVISVGDLRLEVTGDLDTVTAELDSGHNHDFPGAATKVASSGPDR